MDSKDYVRSKTSKRIERMTETKKDKIIENDGYWIEVLPLNK